ncbi:MAG: hypothetical protein QNI90_05605 [Dinoroseobacter sp.]|nr:hypothetical protein [Dinoroseobacter sp.]
MWLEGHYSYHGRYGIGGYEPGVWWVGDIYFNESVFVTYSPPSGAELFETEYYFSWFGDTEQGFVYEEIEGTVEMSLVPVPPALASMGLGLLVLGGWRRLKAR